ncbi:MAG: glycine betaine/L-proline ABC transporter ATP-binding protein [Firmicutes bacterium]|mgnify:CR=1 FL=1|nr:glycine betaine/L-proline ABC transporter ATP-binding protein [Bacillota bacterium]
MKWPMNNILLNTRNVTKLYGTEKSRAIKLKKAGADKDTIYKKTGVTIALWDVSLDIKEGEILVIIGLSGSGKSTLVRCFNMLNKPTSGRIFYRGKNIGKFNRKELNNYRRNQVSMIFQHFGLMSHRNVLGNVEYGLEVKGVPREERHTKAKEMLSMVGLEGYDTEPISSLSGGMKQRVGLARALANDPEILLMDEPFSALDPLVRKDMQFELLTIQRKLDKTIVFITHDINEAFKIGDRVAIMKDGEIIQVATPEKMSEHPADGYVKEFIDNADKTQVITVSSVMITPNSVVRLRDSLGHAINTMKSNGVSSAYVVGEKMRLQGVITIDDTIQANKNNLKITDILIRDVNTTRPDTVLTDIMSMAAKTPFPIAVVDGNGSLKGIVSKVHVLSSML